MPKERMTLADLMKRIDRHREEIVRLVISGLPMTHPKVIDESRKLDVCLNLFYNLSPRNNSTTMTPSFTG